MPIRVGVQVQPQHADFARMREAWRAAEDLGVDSIYTWDHFYPLYGDPDALGRDLPLIRQRLAKLNPPPIGGLPIMIGGGGEKVTLRLVAQHAQLWHTFADPETYLHKSEVLAEHCAKVGRDPATIERVIGTAGSSSEYADALADVGVDELTVGVSGGPAGYDLGELGELLQWRDSRNAAG